MKSKFKCLIVRYFSLIFFLLTLLISCNDTKKEPVSENNTIKMLTSREELSKELSRNAGKMMVIDLYADWCMPCRQLSPILHSLSTEHNEDAVFFKINVDKNPEIAMMFNAEGIPHVVFMKHNVPFYSLTGLYPKETYKKVITVCGAAESSDACAQQMDM